MAKTKKPLVFKSFISITFIIIAIVASLALQIVSQLPNVESLDNYLPSETTQLIAGDGSILARLHHEENREVVPLSRISDYFEKSVIASEDPAFYRHHGFDIYGIFRATIKNIMYGRVVEGGSTISQQLARNIFLTRQKKITRKIAEIILAIQLERKFTKEEILNFYLNQVYLGHNTYGIESASRLYFGKSASELSLAESALLTGLIPGPELYSPFRNFKLAKTRQIIVLNKMIEAKFISINEARAAAAEELKFTPENLRQRGKIGQYFISHVLKELLEKYNEETVYNGGLKVYTTIDPAMQGAAEDTISKFASEEAVRYNFSQSALVAIDPRTGYIKAMVGGVDFDESKFNRVTQSKRQPGSTFKPFVYATAIEQGISPGTILIDDKTIFDVYPNQWNPKGTWEPKNFTGKFIGPVTMRQALEQSLNIPAIKLLERVGISQAINLARRCGIKSHLEPGLALTLGASEVTLLEITSAFGTFANSGIHTEPIAITKVVDRNGQVIYQNNVKEEAALDKNIAAIVVDLMRGVITRGTGVRGQIGRPAAAKTGTSQDFKDAWFIGYVPQLVTGVWVGNDDNTTMEGVAEVGVCPRIWKSFNSVALQNIPALDFPAPTGLKLARICRASGKKPTPYCPGSSIISEYFFERALPKNDCDVHQPKQKDEEFNPYIDQWPEDADD